MPKNRNSLTQKSKRQPEQVKARILAAAISAFAKHGYNGARMRSIANDAGVSIQLLIHHAKTKEQLWQYVMEHFKERYDEFFEQSMEKRNTLSATETLRVAIKEFVLYHASMPDIHRIMVQEGGHLSPRMVWLTENLTKKGFESMIDLIKEAQSEGSVLECNPAQLLYAIIGMSGTPFAVTAEYEYLTGISPFQESEIDRLVDLITELVVKDV